MSVSNKPQKHNNAENCSHTLDAQDILGQMPDLSHSHIRVLARLIDLGCFIIALNGIVWAAIWVNLDSIPMSLVSICFIFYSFVIFQISRKGMYNRAFIFMLLGVIFWLALVAIVASGPGLGYGGAVHGFFLTIAVCLYIVLEKYSTAIRLSASSAMLLLFLAFHIPFYDFTPLLIMPPEQHLLAGQITWVSVIVSTLLFALFSSKHSAYDKRLSYSHGGLNQTFMATNQNKHASYIEDQQKERMIAQALPNCSILFIGVPNLADTIELHGDKFVCDKLNTLFGEFDNLVYEHELEKIDTVQNTYMVSVIANGNPKQDAEKLIRFAIECKKIAASFGKIDVRMGIHSGSATMGVVAKPKSVYSIWGENVDFAHNVQEAGKLNEITVSEKTIQYLSNAHKFSKEHKQLELNTKLVGIYQLVS